MKIGIDARLYGTKHRGLGRYVKKLTDGLVKYDSENQYVIFLTKNNYDDFQTDNQKVKKAVLDARWYSLKEQLIASKIVKKEKVDLMHWPHFNVPYFYNQRYIVTIHDLIINHYPDSRSTNLPLWQYKLKLMGYQKILKHAILKAEKIIVPSQFVKNDLLKHYDIPADKIYVIYEGYFLEQGQQKVDVSRFKITKPFLLYVGAAYPHKNLEKLVTVFKKLNPAKKYHLVLVGRDDEFYQRLKKEVGDYKDIIFTGYVSDSELAALYSQAELYVFPSLYEGFGLPPLEAQAHGLPVVSSNYSCLTEVLKDSALYFNPEDENDILQKIKTALNNGQLKDKLSQQGKENIKRFSWQKMVKETHKLYLS